MSYLEFLGILIGVMILYYGVVIFLDLKSKKVKKGLDYEEMELKGFDIENFQSDDEIQSFSLEEENNYSGTYEEENTDIGVKDENFTNGDEEIKNEVSSYVTEYKNEPVSFNYQKLQFSIDAISQTRELFQ